MSDIVFMDTEALGLELDSPIWEFCAIRRNGETGQDDARMHLFINHDPALMSPDLPESFVVDYQARWRLVQGQSRVTQPERAADLIAAFLTGRPHVVGAVPNFDTERIAHQLLRPNAFREPWHYHLIDIENVIVGYLRGERQRAVADGELPQGIDESIGRLSAPPWSSDALSAAVGVDPEQFDRHTAMGDMLWVRAQWDAVMGGAQ